MTANGYLNISTQKAFLPGMPGCLEQYRKLSAAIAEAHKRHCSITVCWLMCLGVSITAYTLKHYHALDTFLRVVPSLYMGLNETISSKSWSTRLILLHLGVYQGDPLLVAIFNTVMATLVDVLVEATSLDYTFANSSRPISVLQYADDTCIVADGLAHCQHMLSVVERWVEWPGMKANVSKCYSLSIAASTAKRYDPELQLCGQKVPYIGNRTIEFLGGPIKVPQTNAIQKQHLVKQLVTSREGRLCSSFREAKASLL